MFRPDAIDRVRAIGEAGEVNLPQLVLVGVSFIQIAVSYSCRKVAGKLFFEFMKSHITFPFLHFRFD